MKSKLSIIVPVYNLESYLPKCVESILSQSFSYFEVILVNDGSTDKSGELCDEYAKLDSRVRVIHKENGGIGSSRNAGLEIAKGEYIGFVDNDDYINKYMFEELYKNAIEFSSDIVVCDYLSVEEEQSVDKEKFSFNYSVQNFSNKGALHFIYENMDKDTFIYPWNKLYKRSLFDDIKYEHGNIYDDETVAHKLLYKSNKVTYIQSELYYYVQRKGSQINSPFSTKKFGRVYALKGREEFFRNKNELELHQKALKHYMEVFFWYYYVAKSNLKGIDKELRKLKQTLDNSLIHLMKLKNISTRQKFMCVCFRIHPAMYEFIRDTKIKISEKQHLS
ncbi:glycosyltransferase family 2 protein [Fredinandcohnia sp. 179-A 10B2 NHS]|uniref:glycosyltransferase family 2 protein n=1 Tax=Fredinandcohnia sp. 179-A 10B2 NHS TaxID=3235176 RepID=UPI00399F631A